MFYRDNYSALEGQRVGDYMLCSVFFSFFFDETGTLEISPKCEKCVVLVFSCDLVMSEPKIIVFVTHFWAVRIGTLRELLILAILFSGFGTEARQQLI